VPLPEGVFRVIRKRKKGPPRIDWYFQAGRGTKSAGPITRLRNAPGDRGFVEEVEAAAGITRIIDPLSVAAMVAAYRGDERKGIPGAPEWERLRKRTREDYSIYLDKIIEAWGELPARSITARGAYTFRDAMAETPVAANHAISIARTLFGWGIPRGFCDTNVFRDVAAIRVEHDSAKPWPEEFYAFVIANAPQDIRRMAILGRATGQRRSDLVQMRPVDVQRGGVTMKIGKLRDKEHWVPLTQAHLAEIRSWQGFPAAPFLVSAAGKGYSPDHLNSRWNRWRASEAALPVRDYDCSIHDLRATAVCDRRLAGLTHQEIAAQICMSIEMVMRYSKKIDQEALAKSGMTRLERAENGAVVTPSVTP